MANHPQHSIPHLLRDRRAEILRTWESEVRRLPVMRDLPRLVLVDHVPALLDRIISIGEEAAGGAPGSRPEATAKVHAASRLQAGVDLRQVVTEFSVLRRTILGVLLSEPAREDQNHTVAALDQAIDDALAASVEQYVAGRERTLQALDDVATATYENPDLDALLSSLLDAFMGASRAVDTGCILLRDGEALVVRSVRGDHAEPLAGVSVTSAGGFLEKVVSERRPRAISHASVDPESGSGILKRLGARALFGAPFVHRDEVIGMALVASHSADVLDDLDVHVLTAIAGRATDVLVQHRLLEDLRAALAAAEAERRRFLDLVENLDESVVWEADPVSLEFSFVSARAERVTGIPAERWTGRMWADHVPPDDLGRLREKLDACCQSGAEARLAHRFVRPDGRTIWLQTGLHNALRDGRSQIRGVSVDVTRLVQALESRDEYLSYISHDVRNPLAGISLHATVLGRMSLPGPEGERVRLIGEKIARAADQVNLMIGDLVALGRFESGNLSIRKRVHRPAALVRVALEDIVDRAAEKGVTVQVEVQETLPEVFCDARRLQQVFSNLLGNALHVTPPGGVIILAAQPAGRDVRFCISDTGPGIPEEERPHIFERRWRGSRTDYEGSGLGLAIARALVQEHGGRIWLDSVEGSSACFCFTLPQPPGGEAMG